MSLGWFIECTADVHLSALLMGTFVNCRCALECTVGVHWSALPMCTLLCTTDVHLSPDGHWSALPT